MSDVWSERAQAYVDSPAHREGEDLDLIVAWAEGAETALDVATGGGHVGRRLREAGIEVVTTDPAPGMKPDVICPAEHLPFADDAFDVVACRVAAHHFDDVPAALTEMARVARQQVLLVDNLFQSDDAEEADRLRDPSHRRNLTEVEWRAEFEHAGLRVDEVQQFGKPLDFDAWLERAGCEGGEAERVRELLADRIDEDGQLHLDRIALKGVPA
jgi:ubiquinone/menaquinone biosynthesis C-methylase UbiE